MARDADLHRVPPNCRFEVDDFEQPWSYNKPFDYIHGRELAGAIRNHEQLFIQAFENLNPNGWFEMATMEPSTRSDDGTHLKATCLLESIENIYASSKMFGKDMDVAPSWKGMMEKVGFINVTEVVYKVCEGILTNLGDTNQDIASSKPLAQRPKTQRTREIPPAQHARSDANIHVRALHSHASVGTC